MLLKDYWLREFCLGLKVAASFDREESYIKTIDGQIRCITAEFKSQGAHVAWNVSYINVFIPAWMVPPIYHSLRREHITVTDSKSPMGVKTLRPTWFEDETVARAASSALEPMHGLRLTIREDALPLREQPRFEALAEVASRGLLAAETWQCNRAHISLRATIDVPLLGTVIEQNGDGLLEDSLMPVGWRLHLDGAVKQRSVHRTTTLQALNDLLSAYDMKRDLVEINYKAAQWTHGAVGNRRHMEPKRGYHMNQLWTDRETDIASRVTSSTAVSVNDMCRVAAAAAASKLTQPDCLIVYSFGRWEPLRSKRLHHRQHHLRSEPQKNGKSPSVRTKPLQFSTRCRLESRQSIIKKDGGEMLVALVLDKPLATAKALVDDPPALVTS